MNNLNRQIISLLHYNVLVRDTLEYGLHKPNYAVQGFEAKKLGLNNEITVETPLKVFIEKNGENGAKLLEKIKDVIDTVYGEESTICHVAGEELRVDLAQSITIFEKVIPLHEELSQIIGLHLNLARKNQQEDTRVEELAKLDEKFYRGVVWFALIPELERQFIEYNKARREANGAVTPQSNFIQGDLEKITNLLTFSRQHARVTDREYTDVLDQVFDVLEEIQGRRDRRQGHTFETDFADLKRSIQNYIAKNESAWKVKYDAILKEFLDEIRSEEASKQA